MSEDVDDEMACVDRLAAGVCRPCTAKLSDRHRSCSRLIGGSSGMISTYRSKEDVFLLSTLGSRVSREVVVFHLFWSHVVAR